MSQTLSLNSRHMCTCTMCTPLDQCLPAPLCCKGAGCSTTCTVSVLNFSQELHLYPLPSHTPEPSTPILYNVPPWSGVYNHPLSPPPAHCLPSGTFCAPSIQCLPAPLCPALVTAVHTPVPSALQCGVPPRSLRSRDACWLAQGHPQWATQQRCRTSERWCPQSGARTASGT